MNGTRRVVYISGTRADFGLMRSSLEMIAASSRLDVGIIVTGMHLDAAYGATVAEIEQTDLPIVGRIPVEHGLPSGSLMARNIGSMIVGLVSQLERLRPDIVLVLGDRGEMLAAAISAIHLGMAVVHIHGGERSGTIDEPVRHAISKLAHYHFVATDESRERLVRMGEDADRIAVVGAPGLDGLASLVTVDKGELYRTWGFDPARPLILLLFHPVLYDAGQSGEQMRTVLQAALDQNAQILALRPNSDAGSAAVASELDRSAAADGVQVVTHLPRKDFISFLQHADVLLGNSSSGIIEAATFGIPVVNVGSRQNLRQRNANVVDVDIEEGAISSALRQALAQKRREISNVYGDGRAGERMVSHLVDLDLSPASLVKANAY